MTAAPEGNYYPDEDPYLAQATQPTGADIEKTLLGILLNQPTQIPAARPHLDPSYFGEPKHTWIYDAILTTLDTGTPVDMLTVHATLKAAGTPRANELRLYLHDLSRNAPDGPLAAHYATAVRDAHRRRSIRTAALQIRQAADNDADLDQVIDTAFAALDHAANAFGTGPTTKTDHSWSPVNLTPVLAGDYLDPPPTILNRTDGIPLIYDGAVHTISGESESGKTWLTLHAATQLLHTGDKVLFLDFEDRADRVIARLLALGAKPDQIQAGFTYVRPDRPLDDTGRTQLAPHLTGVRLVVLDGVTEAMTMHGYDLNSNADSALFQALLPRWIADHGPAVVLIDHVVKNKDEQGRFALGAQHKLAGIDGAAYVVKMLQAFGRGKRGLARVDVAKDRPGHVREHTIGRSVIAEFSLDASIDGVVLVADLTPPGLPKPGDIHGFEPTAVMERISRYVEANPGVSKGTIEGFIGGKATICRMALELLTTRNFVRWEQQAKGKIAHFSVTPYRAENPDNTDQED